MLDLNNMTISPRLLEAINLCSRLHRDQIRKDFEKTPYSSHLFGVMAILSQVTNDEDTLIAGLMHDSLEDVPGYTYEKLTSDCGPVVANIVRGVTEPLDPNKSPMEQLPWLVRKQKYLETLENASNESILVAAADKIHNIMSIKRAIESHDDGLFAKILSSRDNQLLFYEKAYAIAKNRLGQEHQLIRDFRAILDDVTQHSSSHVQSKFSS